MGVLSIYDITGIQDFIFASRKLTEIIGGSHLVADILGKSLPTILKEVLGADNCKVEWEPDSITGIVPEFAMLSDTNLLAEVLYIGGGNAWVAFRNEEDYVRVNQALSVRILEQTYRLRLASVGVRTDFADSYPDGAIAAQRELMRQKAGMIGSAPGGGLSVTKQSVSDGFPVVEIERIAGIEGTLLSTTQVLKRQKYDEVKNQEKNPGTDKKRVETSFEEYANRGEESFLAVVHIDGNNIGATIQDYMATKTSYKEAIPAMRAMSFALSGYYSNALIKLDMFLETARTNSNVWKEITSENDRKRLFDYRKIVQEGDDITFICNGNIALSITTFILRKLAETNLTIPATMRDASISKPVSACAGICFFHSHFPFSYAYAMAEECCSNAKQAGKKGGDAKTSGNWIDFFINGSNMPESVEAIRDQIWHGVVNNEELVGRPYCVVPDKEETSARSLERLDKLLTSWTSVSTEEGSGKVAWPRGKAKALRDALGGLGDPEEILDHMKSLGKPLPGLDGRTTTDDRFASDVISAGMFSVYYDALEIMDLYQTIPEKKEA